MTRRGNGLTADEYTPLADLSADLADSVLAALREAGVAAYVAPVPAHDREAPESGEPGQRLYVDAAARGRAEYVLMDRLPGPRESTAEPGEPADPGDGAGGTDVLELPDAARVDDGDGRGGMDDPSADGRDEDTIWREIVAGFDQDAPGKTWPDRENIDDAGPRITAARIIRPAEQPLSQPEPEPDAGDDSDDTEDEGHYVPPPPPPLPQADPVTKFAWIALAGGPLYLLLTAVLQWEVPGWAAFLAVAAFVGGFVTLVLRMGDDRRDDGPDDGAVV